MFSALVVVTVVREKEKVEGDCGREVMCWVIHLHVYCILLTEGSSVGCILLVVAHVEDRR
jgi:hypothetical protein